MASDIFSLGVLLAALGSEQLGARPDGQAKRAHRFSSTLQLQLDASLLPPEGKVRVVLTLCAALAQLKQHALHEASLAGPGLAQSTILAQAQGSAGWQLS